PHGLQRAGWARRVTGGPSTLSSVRPPARDRARRADRHGALVVTRERPRDHVRRRSERLVGVAGLRLDPSRDLALGVEVAVALPEAAVTREDRVVVVDDLQLRGGLDRVVLLRPADAHELASPAHLR